MAGNFHSSLAEKTLEEIFGPSGKIEQFTVFAKTAPSLSPTNTGRIYFDSATNKFKISENGGAFVNLTSGSAAIGGTGTANTIPKFSSAQVLADSAITDNATVIGIIGRQVLLTPTATFAAAGVSGITQAAHTITFSGANPTTYATFYAAQMGAITLTGTNAGQTVTEAATLSLSLPIKSTNVAATALHGLIIQVTNVSTATTATALTVNAPTGATNNYSAVFIGDVGIGTTAPLGKVDIRTGNLLFDASTGTIFIGQTAGSTTNALAVTHNYIGTIDAREWTFRTNNTDIVTLKSGGEVNVTTGNFGVGTNSPTNLVSLGGNAARIIWMERHTTANTAGNILTLTAGGATSAATDKAGGALILQGGLSTGSAESGVTIQGCVAGASGTADRTQTTAIQVLGNKIGFYAVTAVVRPTALTAQLTSLTHTAPVTPDYAIQDLTSTTPFGFVTKDEGNTVLSVILNLQVRVSELETKLQALGLLT